jgi:hypothetical protein
MNTQTTSLDQLFNVGERFQRSVNVAVDYESEASLDDYVLTSLSNAVLARVSQGLAPGSKNRAWSITGPYGAGKSSAILFLAQTLGYPKIERARQMMQERNPELLQEIYREQPDLEDGGYVIVPVVGTREPIAKSLLEGLIASLSTLSVTTGEIQDHVSHLGELLERTKRDDFLPVSEFEELLKRSAKLIVANLDTALGLLIIYDELGKALEYAALYPERTDIGLLQVIAELAARSGDTPIGLVTVLHQAFEHYAADLSPVQQREWAKVQGRFEDIGFLESPGELLGIIDKAIRRVDGVEQRLLDVINDEVTQSASLNLLPRDLPADKAHSVLSGCAPLHPTVTMVLGRLFRSRLSQNERSLFAFLSSGEPFGFQEYLRGEHWSNNSYRPFYRLDDLYDYIVAAMGSSLYVHAQGKKWAEIEDALERLPREAGELERRLVKTVGLLNILGDQRYLKASREVLSHALVDGSRFTVDAVERAVTRLEDWDLIIFRRFKGAYSLWQGSDIDLNERFDQGFTQVDRTQSLAALLRARGHVKPFLAKRHLHTTGTFRYFEPWIIDIDDLESVSERPFGEADGAVVFVLGTNGTPINEVLATIKRFSAELESPRREMIFFAIPKATRGIREAFEETLTWEWVARNTPELEGDSIARRELAARRLTAQERLERATARCFDTVSSYRASHWIRSGDTISFTSARELASTFSDVCNHVYDEAPIVHNELINRRSISSAASAARRQLIELMLEHGDESRLGIEKYPPEVSLYLSVLRESGLHHQEGDQWVFGPPVNKDRSRVGPLWRAIDDFLNSTEDHPRPVPELYDILQQPPYGIKAGLLPIYVIVAMLHWTRELAVYEEGSFVPEVRIAECERLLRAPERFTLQRYRLDEARKQMLYEYANLLDENVDPTNINQVMAVRPILSFVKQLPEYTLLTSRLSSVAIATRETLLLARDPQSLLFKDLPRALGTSRLTHANDVDAHFMRLKSVLVELQLAYDQLLQELEKQLLNALLLPSNVEQAREEIVGRCKVLKDWISDLRLKAFVQRLSNTSKLHREWIESVAGVVVNKTPSRWNDQDVTHFEVALADIAGQFRRTEDVALAKQQEANLTQVDRIARLAVTDLEGNEQREIVRVPKEQEAEVHVVLDALRNTLGEFQTSRAVRLMVVTELARDCFNEADVEDKGGK